jgi:hypothetical protein
MKVSKGLGILVTQNAARNIDRSGHWQYKVDDIRWLVTRVSLKCHFGTQLVGGWALPLWKIWVRQLGLLFPIHGKLIQMFQTTNQPNHISQDLTMWFPPVPWWFPRWLWSSVGCWNLSWNAPSLSNFTRVNSMIYHDISLAIGGVNQQTEPLGASWINGWKIPVCKMIQSLCDSPCSMVKNPSFYCQS